MRFEDWLKSFPHKLHLYGFSPDSIQSDVSRTSKLTDARSVNKTHQCVCRCVFSCQTFDENACHSTDKGTVECHYGSISAWWESKSAWRTCHSGDTEMIAPVGKIHHHWLDHSATFLGTRSPDALKGMLRPPLLEKIYLCATWKKTISFWTSF